MKKIKQTDDLRTEYSREDFAAPMIRGKYAKRIEESSNIVVIRPEISDAFPNEKAVNDALLSLIEIAQKSTGIKKSPVKRIRKTEKI